MDDHQSFTAKFLKWVKSLSKPTLALLLTILVFIIISFGMNILPKYFHFIIPLTFPIRLAFKISNNPLISILIHTIFIYILILGLIVKKKSINITSLLTLLFLYSYAIIYEEGYKDLFTKLYKSPIDIGIGGSNIKMYIAFLSIVITALILLYFLNKKINPTFISKTFVRYFFKIWEVVIGLFITIIIANYHLQEGAQKSDVVAFWLFVITTGFFIFLVLEIIKKYCFKKFNIKD